MIKNGIARHEHRTRGGCLRDESLKGGIVLLGHRKRKSNSLGVLGVKNTDPSLFKLRKKLIIVGIGKSEKRGTIGAIGARARRLDSTRCCGGIGTDKSAGSQQGPTEPPGSCQKYIGNT